jgi:hypothetical protein
MVAACAPRFVRLAPFLKIRNSLHCQTQVISPMEIPFTTWHDAIYHRRSRRDYDSTDLEPDLPSHMQDICRDFRPFPQARAKLVTHSVDEIFKGVIGHYGKIKGAPALIALVGNIDDPYIQEKVGYLGEGIILEATAMGLATCWVGGFFRPKIAASIIGTGENERVLAVTPIGHAVKDFSPQERTMMGLARSHRRKPLAELVTGLEQAEWPHWMKSAMDAAALAPSAINRQPWRFHVEPHSITVSVHRSQYRLKLEFGISKRLDCGIAMLHIEVVALDCGVRGRWEFLEAPKVARFTVISGG